MRRPWQGINLHVPFTNRQVGLQGITLTEKPILLLAVGHAGEVAVKAHGCLNGPIQVAEVLERVADTMRRQAAEAASQARSEGRLDP